MQGKKRKSAKTRKPSKRRKAPMSPLNIMPGVNLGDQEPKGWNPTAICYYKLGLSMQNDLRFKFLESGYVEISDPSDLDDFLTVLQAGEQELEPFDAPARAPNMIVDEHCYMVIELDDSVNWRFLQNTDAVTIGSIGKQKATQANVEAWYFLLNHVDPDGGNPTSTGPGNAKTCRLVYFGAKARQTNSDPKENFDQFNLNLEFDQGFGHLLPIVLDPDIKNDGGTNPPLIYPPMARVRGRHRAKR